MARLGKSLLVVVGFLLLATIVFATTASRTDIDTTIGSNDAWDAFDVDGDGDEDICIGDEFGRAYYFENDGDGTFTKHTIRSSAIPDGDRGVTKNEGAIWVDPNDDGNYECAILDQRSGRVFLHVPDVAGTYTGSWSYGTIQDSSASSTGKVGFLQDGANWDVDFDGDPDIFLAFDGYYTAADQAEFSGFAWLEYTSGSLTASTSYTFNKVNPSQTGRWITRPRKDLDGDGNADDFVFAGRNSYSGSHWGVYAALAPDDPTNDWSYATLTPANEDWTSVDWGNFFGTEGDTRRDIVAQNYDGDVYVFDFDNGWASTSITTNNPDEARFHLGSYHYATNSRDRFITTGGPVGGFSATGDIVMWYWDGDSWEKEFDNQGIVGKTDDRILSIDLDGSEPDEIVMTDSGQSDFLYLTISDLQYSVDLSSPFNRNTITNIIFGNAILTN